jgi:hypothetical protein
MKAKITKKDGTIIELEGTAAELGPFIDSAPITIKTAPACPGLGDMGSIGKLIDELMKGSKDAPYQPQYPLPWPQIIYNDMCPMGGSHEFPQVWMSITPPACSKCGRSMGQAPSTTVVSTQTISGDLVENGTNYKFAYERPTVSLGSAFTVVPPDR